MLEDVDEKQWQLALVTSSDVVDPEPFRSASVTSNPGRGRQTASVSSAGPLDVDAARRAGNTELGVVGCDRVGRWNHKGRSAGVLK